jgi:hypothetical protein
MENTERTKRLEDTERRYRDVTESLSIQTTELAKERRDKRASDQVLAVERKLHKETKKKLKAFKSVKSENTFDA